MMQCDILNLEWSSSGRDREVATPICHALRRKGYSVVEASIFNYKYYLLKYKPRLLYIADPVGAKINYKAIKFAYKLGIPTVTYTAEGNYRVENFEKVFWGHITNRQFLEQIRLQWSNKTRQLTFDLIDSSLKTQIKISGGVGFDRYKIYKFRTKKVWMKKYALNYTRMIGYATWGFDKFYDSKYLPKMEEIFDKHEIERFRHDRVAVNSILKDLISQNPDTLFLLKEHPGVNLSDKTELVGLSGYANVLSIKNNEAIGDCINSCDIWMAYESTTCLEAWLLNKPTLLINPSGVDFTRTNIYKGSPIFVTYNDIQKVINNFYAFGQVTEFESKQQSRQQVIEEIIQWADGKNHLRAAYLIEQVLLKSGQLNPKFGFWDRFGAFVQNFLFEQGKILPPFPGVRRFIKARKMFDPSKLEALTRRYAPYLNAFYQQNDLTEQDILELERINL